MTSAEVEPIVGRYVRLTDPGRAHRVYLEEAAAGIPWLCLHTAGSGARQSQHLMRNAAIASQFHVIAFSMPSHS